MTGKIDSKGRAYTGWCWARGDKIYPELWSDTRRGHVLGDDMWLQREIERHGWYDGENLRPAFKVDGETEAQCLIRAHGFRVVKVLVTEVK